jgi:acyl carrier protein
MTGTEVYNQVFIKSFKIDASQLNSLTYRSISGWDSIGHMVLIAGLEEAFNIMLDTDDIIGCTSYEKGKLILKKYDVEF